jgi:ribosome-associated heat shock protein Hsp15
MKAAHGEHGDDEEAKVRIDKWLWAARFFKTRSLATQAVEAGRVHHNGNRVKPARDVRAGDELSIHIGQHEWIVIVRAVSDVRRGAPEAQKLYEEKPDSLERRLAAIADRKALRGVGPVRVESGRPTKRDRRMIRRFTDD